MPITPLKFSEVLVLDTTASLDKYLPKFVKDNHAYGIGNVVRGMHFQNPVPQTKLVECECGKAWNVVIDVRSDSPTFGQWDSVILEENDNKKLYIPEGFAHGFYTLGEENYIIIKLTTEHDKGNSITVAWDDGAVGIDWPFLDKDKPPILSPEDVGKPKLSDIPVAQLPKCKTAI